MADETVDQLKKQRVIEHMQLAITDLQRYQSNPIIVNTMIQLHDALVLEYNTLYQIEEGEPKPSADKGKKGEKDTTKI